VRLEVGVDVELKRQMDLLTSFLGNMRKNLNMNGFEPNIVSKFKTKCSYCGHDWSDEKYDGSCCKKAKEEFMKSLEGAAIGGI
jgi:lipid A disaccharide synthetase